MGFADYYLAKYAENILPQSPGCHEDTGIIIIMPAFNESGLIKSLDSLFKCNLPECKTEVLIMVNWPEDISEELKQKNLSYFDTLKNWIASNTQSNMVFHPLLYPDMPAKHAGVGLARKTLMDEAVRRFNLIACPGGIIVSLDADSICDPNYLQEIENHFKRHQKLDGCVIYFEHPTSGDDFPPGIYKGIALYELHLRYYVESIRYTGFQNAFHTIGSSFAVKADAYCRQGGMNKRKAGEDFYFLQKFFELGTFNELNSTRVIPSPRPSSRVPFGTGAAINRFEQNNEQKLFSYNLIGFKILKEFFNSLPEMHLALSQGNHEISGFNYPEVLNSFLNQSGFSDSIVEIYKNSASFVMFKKRFFRWFNLFRILKFLNHIKSDYPDMEVETAAQELLRKADPGSKTGKDALALLEYYRKKQRVLRF